MRPVSLSSPPQIIGNVRDTRVLGAARPEADASFHCREKTHQVHALPVCALGLQCIIESLDRVIRQRHMVTVAGSEVPIAVFLQATVTHVAHDARIVLPFFFK